ncbi:hypothetical protein SK128_023366, partial [Halocaridina rubra]
NDRQEQHGRSSLNGRCLGRRSEVCTVDGEVVYKNSTAAVVVAGTVDVLEGAEK